MGMRIYSAFGWILGAAGLAFAVAGCSDDSSAGGCARKVVTSNESCQISADCASAGLDLSCIDGICRLACRTDTDCDLIANADPADPIECRADPATTPAAFCQAGRCEVGCPEVACGAGEVCFGARCVLYGEGFEVPAGADGVDLPLLGFNDLPTTLSNGRTKVLSAGQAGCIPAVDRNCNGPAAQGENFVVLETVPAPAKGIPETGPTCRACACCLECLADPPSAPVSIANCPSPEIPSPLTCPASHPSCDGVCALCDQCPAATNRPSDPEDAPLASCEATAAGKRCSLCDACDAFLPMCQSQSCPVCATAPTSTECRDCVEANCLSDQRCQNCQTCQDAQLCRRTTPGSPECNLLSDACDLQGDDGCYAVPVRYPRAQLFDEEQALTSPAIDLSSATEGDVVLQFDYVSFDVGVSYFPGVQGTPPEQWTEADQNVRVQFCAGTCGRTDWSDGQLVSGAEAVLPSLDERNNGRLLGDQTLVDWRAGRVEVVVPSNLRSAGFRYRLLPSLNEGARLGVDNILVRRTP